MRNSWLVLAALVMLGVGCSRPGVYWQNRALDFADCFRGEVGTGYGLDIQVGATDWLAAGLGGSSSQMVGFVGRHPVGAQHGNDRNAHIGFPVCNVLVPVALLAGEEIDYENPLLLFCCAPFMLADAQYRNVPRSKTYQSWIPFVDQRECSPLYREVASGFGINIVALADSDRGRGLCAPGPKLVDAFEVDIGATLVVVSARGGFSFGQFADLVLGVFGLDIAGDDTGQ
jgi:hypothetical protein